MTVAQACCVYHKFFRSFFFDFPSNLAVSEFSGEYSIVSSFVWSSVLSFVGSNLLSLRATSLLPYLELGHKELMKSLCLSQVVVGSELVAVVIPKMV